MLTLSEIPPCGASGWAQVGYHYGMTAKRAAVAMVALVLLAPSVVSAASDTVAAKRPVSSFVDPTFGKVLSRTDKQVL